MNSKQIMKKMHSLSQSDTQEVNLSDKLFLKIFGLALRKQM